MNSSQPSLVPKSKSTAVRLKQQAKLIRFTGFSREIGVLLRHKKKEADSKTRFTDIRCNRCAMSLTGEYPIHEAIPLEKEFKRIHGNHDIVKMSLSEKVRGVIKKWI